MIDHQVKKRSKWLQLLLLFGMTALIGRLGYIQLFMSESWTQAAQSIWREDDKIPAIRGTIYDRNGKELAYTTVAYNVQADRTYMEAARKEAENAKQPNEKDLDPGKGDPKLYAQLLAPVLKMSEQELYEKLSEKNRIGIPLKQKVDADTAKKIENLKLKGVFLTSTTTRHYPNGTLAAHVLGFVANGQGAAGIELQYNDELIGRDGERKFMRDSRGNPLPYEKEQVTSAVDGKDIWLTIDETIQHYAEDALDHLMDKYKPKHASIVVADPNTGEILALANRPTFDPNQFGKYEQTVLDNNRAVNSAFEPGSTFKIVTMTAALNEKKVNLNDTFPSGKILVNGQQIHDWNYKGWGTITFRQGMAHSSNVGMVLLGQRLGKEKLFDYIYRFGFNQKTGIDLPGEGNSVLFNPKTMSDLDLAVTAFGQGNAVTPMQQVAAVSAVANGGKVIRPFVMKEIRNPESGATIQEQKPHVISQVATPEVMAAMRDVMLDVINSDETKAGYIEGYRIAGKTGTAQILKSTGGYEADSNIGSFIGFAPADKPKVLVYVTVDSPKSDIQFGNVVATPFAKEVFANVLPYLGIKPENDKQQQAVKQPVVKYSTVPDWQGMNRQQANEAGRNNQLVLQILGSGDTISRQWPAPGSKVPAGSLVILMTGQIKDVNGNVQVPDLTGKSLRESIDILSMLELGIDPAGSGAVVGQDQKPGSIVPAGTKIKVTLGQIPSAP